MKKILSAAIPILLLPLVSQAQLKLGNNPTSIDPSAILELEHPNKALYISRVNLNSTTDYSTVNTPKAGMVVYNTNSSISSSNPNYPAQGTGIYYFDGTGWIYTGNSTANNGLTKTGNNIQLGGSLVKPTTITTTGSNNLEIQSTDIGGTSPEINQGLNVLTTAATSSYAIGSRGRVLVPTGKTVGQTRGVSGATTVNGTVSSSATGGYFNSKLDGATLSTGAVSTGVSADAEVVTATANYTNALIGGRFGANAKTASAANAIGTYAAGVGSAASNVGVYASAGNSGVTNAGVVAGVGDTATIATAMMTTAMGKNAAVIAVNPTAATAANAERAIFSNGGVQMTNLGVGAPTQLLGVDASGNVKTTTGSGLVTTANGISKDGITGDIILGGTPLDHNTTIDQNSKDFAFTNADRFAVNTGTGTTTERLLVRNDGSMAMGNAPAIYSSNKVEVNLANVGGPVTSGEQNQGVNVLASSLDGSAQSTALRARMNVNTGTSATAARGLQGNVGIDGTLNGGASGGYFNAVVRNGATLGSSAVLTAVSADAEANTGAPSGAATNYFIGGRFSSNATNASNANTIGVYTNAVGSTNTTAGSNTGIYAVAANTAKSNTGIVAGVGGASIATDMAIAATGKNVAVVAVNPTAATAANAERAIFSNGGVQMTNLGAGAPTQLLGVDASGNVKTTTGSGLVTTANGISKDGITGDIILGGTPLDHNTTIDQNSKDFAFTNADRFAVNTGTGTTTERLLVRNDGSMAMGNAPAIYSSNKVEVNLANVGGPVTSGEQNQGVNVLASSLDGSAQSTALRARMNVNTGTSATAARGLQGNVGIDGTLNGGASGGYFNAVVRNGATLGSSAVLTAVSADAEANTGAPSGAATNYFIGGRFSSNATNASNANTIGVYTNAVGSTNTTAGSNTGIYAVAANTAKSNTGIVAGVGGASIATDMAIAATGKNVAVVAVNPTAATAANAERAIFSNGGVQMTNLGAGAPTQLLGVDASGNVKTTVPSAIVTTYGWGITGNTGTTAGTNFIGNSDDVALVFKVKNDFSGQISNSNTANTAGNMNTAFGYKAAAQSSAGYGNSAFGYKALNASTTGISNTAMGIYALNSNTTGGSNTAIGTYTLMNNSYNTSLPTQRGEGNTAVGANSMYGNTYGSNNSGIGARSLNRNTTGMNNTALGYSAMNNNTTGYNNTSVGVNSMYNSLPAVSTTGRDNSALGFQAMANTSSGNFNTALGSNALRTNSTGDYNTAIGTNADVSAVNLTKATAIGYNAVVAASNSMVLGGTGADVVSVGINTTTPTSRLYVNGSFGTAIRTTAASTTLDETDHTLIITGTASTGTVTLTVPAAAAGNKGRIYRIVNQTGNTQATSVSFQDFTGTAITTVPTGKLVIQSDGANWYQID